MTRQGRQDREKSGARQGKYRDKIREGGGLKELGGGQGRWGEVREW